MQSKTTLPDEYTVAEAIERGHRAYAVLNDSIFQESVARAELRFYDGWLAASKPEDREAYWAKTHALAAVQDELRNIVADGEVAASRVE
jgi:DNA gyrase inhibitor GyrI